MFNLWTLPADSALLVGLLHFAVAAAVAVDVLLRKRDVPTAIGWIGIAWLAPDLVGRAAVGCSRPPRMPLARA